MNERMVKMWVNLAIVLLIAGSLWVISCTKVPIAFWAATVFLGLIVVYCMVRLCSYAIFKSYSESKVKNKKRR